MKARKDIMKNWDVADNGIGANGRAIPAGKDVIEW